MPTGLRLGLEYAVRLMSEGNVQRRLLFLLPFAPRLDAIHGGGRAAAQLIAGLSERHQVGLLYLRATGEPPLDHRLRERCALVEEIIRPDIKRSWLRRARLTVGFVRGRPMWATDWAVSIYAQHLRALVQSWQPDLIQIEYHVMGQYLPALVGYPAPRVLTIYEPGTSMAADLWPLQRGYTRLLCYLDMLVWRRFEAAITRNVNTVTVFTERDRQALAQLAGRTPIVQIPLSTALPAHRLNPLGESPPSLFFVGNFVHHPNVDAATRLISAIFPFVAARYPEARVTIVGDRPPLQIRKMAGERVIVTGRVPDVEPYLDRAAVVVVPIHLGGGMRVKVLEALAAGKAVVATRRAVEGLDLVDGEHAILAETDQQFGAAILQLLANPAQRAALAARARAWACDNLGWDNSIRQYELLYDSLLGGKL